jgi:DNA-binding HxlR family transcriptional regulator
VALPREYIAESCPIARTLEIVGERWTLLVVRDAFYGVRRFSDFRAHLDIPKAVLADRLSLLVDEGVLVKVAGGRGRDEYTLSPKGRRLWPTIWSLAS